MITPLILSALLVAGPSAAGPWTPAPPAGALDDDNPAAVAALQFEDQLQNSGYRQFCDHISLDIPLGYNDGLATSLANGDEGFLSGGQGELSRRFYRYPDGHLALIDEADADISLGDSQEIFKTVGAPVSLLVTSLIQGQSLVVRPLQNKSSCQDMKRLVDVMNFKTVTPLTAQRISRMQTGELWKIPLTLEIAFGPRIGDYPTPGNSFSLYFSYAKSRVALATLYRLGPRQLRFRLHLDHITAVNATGMVVGSPLPIIDANENGTQRLLASVFPQSMASGAVSLAADALNQYLSAYISFSKSKQGSQEVMLEYVLDPSAPEQMAGLEKALRGDVGGLALLQPTADLRKRASDAPARSMLETMKKSHDSDLKTSAGYAGAQSLLSHSREIKLHIPIAIDFDSQSSRQSGRIISLNESAGTFRSWQAEKSVAKSYLAIPIAGAQHSHQTQNDVEAVTYTPPSQGESEPFLIYIQQEGFTNASAKTANQLTDKINGLLGVMNTPVPNPSAQPKGRYTGAVALTLVLDRQAVADALSAGPMQILQAYARSLDGAARAAMDSMLKSAVLSPKRIELNPDAVLPGSGAANLAEDLAEKAAKLVQDFQAASRAPDPESRSRALVRLVSGGGASGLAYSAVMKVILQLVPAQEVGGEYLFLLSRPHGSNSASRYILNSPLFKDPTLKAFSRLNRRFMPPLPLAD